jgi:3-hydroxyisobutyrate dehydrogenase
MIVAVLGTGTMGAPMAANLAERAFGEVRVWNRSSERAAPLAEQGATVAASVAEAVEGADVVLVMLSDGDAVLSVLDEALPAMGDDAILLQASTIGLEATERAIAKAADRGVAFVDAPVVGTREPAEKGRLVILASGPDEALDRCDAIFDAVGMKTLRLGEAGAGSKMKLVANAWIVSLVESLAETVALAESLDVDPKAFLGMIAGGPLDSGYAQLKGGAMADRSFEPASFALSLAAKDARLVLAAAERGKVSLPVVEAVAQQMEKAVQDGHGDKDLGATFHASAG